jgi:cyclase
VIAQDNVRKRLAPGDAAALPIITFEHDVTVHLNGEDVRALHVPSGHTDGDAVIFFPKSNVVHLGDDFVTYGFPFVDVASGGSVKGMIEGVESVIAQLPPDVKVIPGHGPISTLDDVRRFVAMLKDTRAAVEKALAAGQKPEELKASPLLDPWKSYAGDFVTSEKWLQTLLTELLARKPGPFVRHN